jgi:Mrp family chromosome partitioning ATPase
MTTQSLTTAWPLLVNIPPSLHEVAEVTAKNIDSCLTFAGAEPPPASDDYLAVVDNLLCSDWWTPRRIFVTSPSPGDGKTCTSFNLAWALKSRGQSTLLVELNFARPKFRTLLGDVKTWRGFESTLHGWSDLGESAFSMGTPGPDVCAVKDAVRSDDLIIFNLRCLQPFLDLCSEKYEWIVLDCPGVLSRAWSEWFRKYANPTLLVIREQQTPLVEVQKAARLLGANLKAVLLNDSAVAAHS